MRVFFLLFCGAALFAQAPVVDIKVDQAGYAPRAPKIALVVAKEPAAEFSVRDAGGKVAFRGKLAAAVEGPDSGDRVQAADFTKLTKPGKYSIDVPGVGRSWEFAIAPDVYQRAYYLAMRSFYGQRCGTAVDLGPEFPGYSYGACHPAGAWHASSGKSGPRASMKGWHDAGDYGRYIVNSGITTGTLLWAWEMFGPRVKNVSLKIPESGNGTPDMLNEIRWNLEWMLTMQDTDGGVWHKQTSERFAGFVMPDKDASLSYVIGVGNEPWKGSCATADFAAVMAIAGRVYRPYDRAFAGKALEAAQRAWSWVEKNPNALYTNPPGVATGAYGDRDCRDERLWAAAELYRTAGDDAYHRYFLDNYAAFRSTIRAAGPMAWPNVAPMGLWTYALGKGKDAAALAAIREDSLRAAREIVQRTSQHGYRTSMTTKDYVWGSNGVVANYGVQLLVAHALQPGAAFLNAAIDNLHYLLGRNPFSLSYVTQVGANPFRHPHHRPSGADSNPEPWPGMLSGGPNQRKQDAAMRKLPDLPPMKMFVDAQESYASNEIAINWNAPLVFLLAGAMQAK
jgi:endoglucanase